MIVHQFSRTSGISIMIIGMIAGMVPALQGTLLFQMQMEGLVSQVDLGRIAMAEALGTLLSVTFAIARLKHERLRLYVIGAAIAGLLIDLATTRLSGGTLLAARFSHGLCAGILLWVWIGFVTRSVNPGRWFAIYMTTQASTLLVLSTWFSTSLLPMGGAFAGFAVLAGLYALMGLMAPLVPRRYDLLGEGGCSVMPDAKGFIALFAVFAQVSAILALWVYIKPYGQQIGLSGDVTGLAVSIALGSQIVAGLLATCMAGRVRAAPILAVASAASIASLVALAFAHAAVPFIAATTAFAFLWMLAPCFHMPYLIDLDPSRRSALHTSTAQLLGVAVGPALASLAVNGDNVSGAIVASGILHALAVLVVVLTGIRKTPVLA